MKGRYLKQIKEFDCNKLGTEAKGLVFKKKTLTLSLTLTQFTNCVNVSEKVKT